MVEANKQVMDSIQNGKLRSTIREIDQAKNRRRMLDTALQTKEFREFADQCLKSMGYLDESGQFCYDFPE